MAATVLADTSFLIALINRRDTHRPWAMSTALRFLPPWQCCEAVISELSYLIGPEGFEPISELLRRDKLKVTFRFSEHQDEVLALMRKFASVPMSFADACLVRMCEVTREPVVLTADSDFRLYRRLGRQAIPVVMPD